jgi:hypothetical protein
MKGLSLTLTIVIIAIVLLVTALVIMTIFGGQMAQFIGILNPWSAQVLNQNLCYQQCAAWCQGNPGAPGTGWDTLPRVKTQEGDKSCGTEIGMFQVAGADCKCTGIPTAGGCTVAAAECEGKSAGPQEFDGHGCTSPTPKCRVVCPAGGTGTCVA